MRSLLLLKLLVLTIFSFAGIAFAQSGFSIVGSWQSGYSSLLFNQDGTFQGSASVAPDMNGRGGGHMIWRGNYKLVSTTAWVAEVTFYQFCAAGGGCASCPKAANDVPNTDGCEGAQNAGLQVGVQATRTFQPTGYNQFADQFGRFWQRAGTFASGAPPASAPMRLPPASGPPSPMQPCSLPGQTFCPSSGWLLTCNGTYWLTGAQRC